MTHILKTPCLNSQVFSEESKFLKHLHVPNSHGHDISLTCMNVYIFVCDFITTGLLNGHLQHV